MFNNSKTINTYEKFYNDEDRVRAFMKWEKKESDDIRMSDGSVPRGVLPNGRTLFEVLDTGKKMGDGGTLVTETEHFNIIIPGGYRDYDTFNGSNPVKYSLGGMRALMSLVHLIAVPKKGSPIRICNAVTMDSLEHGWLISEMEQGLVRGILKLIDGGTDMPYSVRWHLIQNKMIHMSDGIFEHSTQITDEDMSNSCKDSFNGLLDGRIAEVLEVAKNNIKFSFHLDDVCSIMNIHCHGYCGNLLTLAHDMMEEDANLNGTIKNTPSDTIKMMINSGISKRMKYNFMNIS
mgnify:CR=1 FL=1